MNPEIESRLESIRREGRFRQCSIEHGVSFVHNDYLGLSNHPRILQAGKEALDLWGAGSRGSRLLGGHSRLFEETEAKVAHFFGSPDALFFSTGYLANLAAIGALSTLCERIYSDEKNHASLIDATRLSRIEKEIVPHRAWDTIAPTGKSLLVSESLFSMDGSVAPLEKIQNMVGPRHYLLVDEAHAVGVFKEEGRGLMEGHSPDWDRTIVNVTFGKAFGVAGAALLCSVQMKQWLVNEARTFIYTTAPSPIVVAMVQESLAVAREEGWRRQELWERSSLVREILTGTGALVEAREGFEGFSPIVILRLEGPDKALRFCENMRESGVDIRPIRFPTVPRGEERIRISLNLGVSRDNTEAMAEEVVKRWPTKQ